MGPSKSPRGKGSDKAKKLKGCAGLMTVQECGHNAKACVWKEGYPSAAEVEMEMEEEFGVLDRWNLESIASKVDYRILIVDGMVLCVMLIALMVLDIICAVQGI